MADLIDYVMQFPDLGTALRDQVIGGFFTTPPLAGFPIKQALVYPNRLVNSVTPSAGYWLIITNAGTNAALDTHPNTVIINDLTLMNAGMPSVVMATFAITNTIIVNSGYGLYCAALQLI